MRPTAQPAEPSGLVALAWAGAFGTSGAGADATHRHMRCQALSPALSQSGYGMTQPFRRAISPAGSAVTCLARLPKCDERPEKSGKSEFPLYVKRG